MGKETTKGGQPSIVVSDKLEEWAREQVQGLIQRPRVRGLEQQFESRALSLVARRSPEIDKLIPDLYLHGPALGDFDMALSGLLGEAAPVSDGTVARLEDGWRADWEEWKRRPLDGLDVVYIASM